jgi:hypothetical protein
MQYGGAVLKPGFELVTGEEKGTAAAERSGDKQLFNIRYMSVVDQGNFQ